MSSTSLLTQSFVEHAREFWATLPGIGEGDAEAVHEARVAVRRMRAICPLLSIARQRSTDRLAIGLRDVGRALGRARDLDVSIELLSRYEREIPPLAPSAVAFRQSLEARRWPSRRKLIKHLETPEVAALNRDLIRLTHRAGPQWFSRSPAPSARLGSLVAARGLELAAAVRHAGGVYFPNRLHRVRVAAKKLRYLLEVAFRLGLWGEERDVKTLKRTQELLGEMHDRQVLLDVLETQSQALPGWCDQAGLSSTLHAERDDFHARYLERRADVLCVCEDVRLLTRPPRYRHAIAAGAVGLSAAVWLIHRSLPTGQAVQGHRVA